MAIPSQSLEQAGMPLTARPGWTASPRFMVRSAGFPFALVDTASQDLLTALTRRRLLRGRLEAQRATLTREAAPAAKAELAQRGAGKTEYKALYRLIRVATTSYRQVTCPPGTPASLRRWAECWNASAEALDDDQAETVEQARTAERRAVALMGRLADDPAFRDAVLLSSPGVFDRVVAGWRWSGRNEPAGRETGPGRELPGRERQDARTVYAYAQRFATKNETTSFFGPVDYGWLRPAMVPGGSATGVRLRRAPGLHLARKARLTAWATEAISAAVASDPALRGQLPVRIRPGLAVSDGALLNALTGRRVRVPEAWLHALDVCGRGVALETARARCGTGTVELIVERGLAEVGWVLPAAVDDPLEWVRGQLAGMAEGAPEAAARWLGVFDRFQCLVRDFERAAGERRQAALARVEREFSRVTGKEPRRGDGRMYADRMVVTEDCRGNADILDLGADAAAAVTRRLAPVLDLCVAYSTVVREVIEEKALDVFARAAPAGRMPYLAFAAAVDQAIDMDEVQRAPAVRDWLARLDRLVLARERDGTSQLGLADLPGLLRARGETVVLSPDIFIGGDPCLPGADLDTMPIVVGEIHHGVQTWTHLSILDPELGAAERAVAGLTADLPLAGNVFRRTEGKAFERELPGPVVEFRSVSAHAQARPLRIESLWVVLDSGRPRLITETGEQLPLRARHPRCASNWLLGQLPVIAPTPLRSARRAPRVLVGDVTAWRRRWVLDEEGLAPLRRAGRAGELVCAADDLRDETGLPRLVFARTAGARKPVFADLSCPLSLRHLIHYAGEAPDLTLTEMLPVPGQWWWSPAGVPQSCEWRMAFASASDRGPATEGME
jgi:hypothetical protein